MRARDKRDFPPCGLIVSLARSCRAANIPSKGIIAIHNAREFLSLRRGLPFAENEDRRETDERKKSRGERERRKKRKRNERLREKGGEEGRGKKVAKRHGQKIALVRLKYDERFDRVSDGRAKLHIKLIPTATTTR